MAEQKVNWTIVKVRRIKDLKDNGLSYAEIARIFGVSKGRIYQMVKAYPEVFPEENKDIA